MDNMKLSEDLLREILDDARLAPSAHNSQPWKVRIENNQIIVTVNGLSSLVDGDPTGRQTVIGLGIFVKAFLISAGAKNLSATKVLFNKDEVRAEITLSETVDPQKTETAKEQLVHLKNRVTDRSVYENTAISDNFINTLSDLSTDDVQVIVTNDTEIINKVAGFTAQGISMALSNPDFRKELSKYIIPFWKKRTRGIPVNTLRVPMFVAMLQPFLLKRGFLKKTELKVEKKRWESASAVILVLGKGDTPKYWFEVGSVYLDTCLCAESFGFSQATSAAIVEASDFHEDIESMLNTTNRILSVTRIGKSNAKKRHSPRVSVDDLLTT